MYEYQEKKISKIAKATAKILSQRFSNYLDAPELDTAKIEHAIITSIDITAEALEPIYNERHMKRDELNSMIERLMSVCMLKSNVWEIGWQDYQNELTEIVKEELSERRRSAIRDSFRDIWDDDTTPESIDGELQQDLIDMYRNEY